jgi:hypothetical protein
LPWIARIVAVAIALPVIAAGAVGSAVGAFSLRYRAPVRDRDALGIVGRPIVAVPLAGVLLVASALAGYLPGSIAGLAVRLAIAAVALIWLRRTLHVGLLEEAFEAGTGDEITCANCGARTPQHTFCGNCGIALHALPKRSSRADAAAPSDPAAPGDAEPPAEPGDRAAGMSGHYRTARAVGDETARLERRRLLTLFFIVLVWCSSRRRSSPCSRQCRAATRLPARHRVWRTAGPARRIDRSRRLGRRDPGTDRLPGTSASVPAPRGRAPTMGSSSSTRSSGRSTPPTAAAWTSSSRDEPTPS